MSLFQEIKQEALLAEQNIRAHIRETPLEFSPYLSSIGQGQVYLKLENFQITGSFKIRGALNKLLSLPEEKKKGGITTASSGNHGAAVSFALAKLGMQGTIFLPTTTSQTKVEILKDHRATVEFFGDDCVKAEIHARQQAEKTGSEFISPYNDMKIIGGQATVGIELRKQISRMDAVFVPVGGGGLISGIAAYLKTDRKHPKIIGCQPENSCVMHESVKAGQILEMESKPTLSDGTAGGIEAGAITFELCRDLVDNFILVSEKEIKQAILLCLKKHHMLVEGAAALSVASFLKVAKKFQGKTVILVLSGAKISLDQLEHVLCEGV